MVMEWRSPKQPACQAVPALTHWCRTQINSKLRPQTADMSTQSAQRHRLQNPPHVGAGVGISIVNQRYLLGKLANCDEKTEAGSKRSRATKDGFVEPGLRPLERGLARLGSRQPIVQVRDPADGAGVHQGADPVAQVVLPGELKESSECSSSNACWTSSCVSALYCTRL